jgi:hypothetical protein
MVSRPCSAQGCTNRVTGNRNRKYCSDTCSNREKKRRHRAKQTTEVVSPARVRYGDAYETLSQAPDLVTALAENRITQRTAAQVIGVSESHFAQAYANFLAEEGKAQLVLEWTRDPEIDRLLAVGGWDWDENPDTLEDWLDFAVEAFVTWRERYFTTPRGPYVTKDFHRDWIRIMLRSLRTGGRYLILSPPRHGKSELLIHFSTWLICRDPNVRIVWVSANETMAETMVSMVKTILEKNSPLRTDILGPVITWQPQGRMKTRWGLKQFTVANRTLASDIKAPTMAARGRRGSILSMDVDLICMDDIEDVLSTEGEAERGKTRNWVFNTVESRKEEHTAWVTIGSRQHPDDVYDYLLDDPEWEATVNAAHDPLCPLPEYDENVHTDCMLFPELRSYSWLMSKKRSAESQGLLSNWEMIYQNDPRPIGLLVFTTDMIDRCKNRGRGLGLEGMRRDVVRRLEGMESAGTPTPEQVSYHLVGGLDPSATGFQSGFLWAWVDAVGVLYCIDATNRKGGGIYPFLDLMVEWLDAYDLRHWVWENNILPEGDLRQNPDVKAFVEKNDIYLEAHTTQGGNKNNRLFGVGGMSNLYEEEIIDLPWGTEAARELMLIYERQMLRFVDGAGEMRKLNRKTDMLMSSWFPMKAIRRFWKEAQAEASAEVGEDFSYEGWDMSTYNEAPW